MDQAADLVTLRPLERQDADVMAEWAQDARFCREAGWSAGSTFEQHQRFHRALIEAPPRELLRLGVVHQGRLVGYVDLHGDEPDRRELGFLIGERRSWGGGLGLRAAVAGLDHGFDRLGLREVWAEALDANRRSIRVLQRLGMTEAGPGEDGVFLDRPTHHRRFTITAEEWARRDGA